MSHRAAENSTVGPLQSVISAAHRLGLVAQHSGRWMALWLDSAGLACLGPTRLVFSPWLGFARSGSARMVAELIRIHRRKDPPKQYRVPIAVLDP